MVTPMARYIAPSKFLPFASPLSLCHEADVIVSLTPPLIPSKVPVAR
jgi:hypothetical protein